MKRSTPLQRKTPLRSRSTIKPSSTRLRARRPKGAAPAKPDANYRNRKLLDLAHRVNECQLQIPDVCQGYSLHGSEPAHANWIHHGKGTGLKAHDVFHAASCSACHRELDQGKSLSREDRLHYWQRGFERTMLLYFRQGWISTT